MTYAEELRAAQDAAADAFVSQLVNDRDAQITSLTSQRDAALATSTQLKADLASSQEDNATLRATVADLQTRLDTCLSNNAPEPQPSTSLLIGARAKDSSSSLAGDLRAAFDRAQTRLGPLQVTRVFYTSLPTAHTRISPDGVLEIISFKSGANLESFLGSLKQGEMIAYHHEPEGDYATGADFVAEWDGYYDRAKKAQPAVQFGMIAGGYQYRSAGKGYDGSFLPDRADWYSIDTYRDGSTENAFGAIVPLTDVAEFQRWYGLVKDRGRPLAVTEYGRGTVGGTEVASTPLKRRTILPSDIDWLRARGFFAFSLWFSDYGPDRRAWCPTDQEYYAAFSALPRG